MGRDHDRVLAKLCGRQHDHVAVAQAVEEGVPRRTFYRRVESGLLTSTRFPGVFRMASAPVRDEGMAMAAVLAAGGDTVVSHTSALALWGLGDRRLRDPIHLTSRERRDRDLPEVVIHHAAYLDRLDTTTLGVVPITAVPATLLGSAAYLGLDDLEDSVIEASRRGLLRVSAVEPLLDRAPRNLRGRRNFRLVLQSMDPEALRRLMSRLEARAIRLIRRSGLPMPAINRRLYSASGELIGIVDFVWDPPGLVVEWDGVRFHSTRRQKEYDDARQNALVLSGRVVLRYSWRDLDDPARIVDEIRRGLALAAS